MSRTIDFENIPTWYIEQAANDIFPGTQMLVRDCNLTDAQLAGYEVGRILREPGFTDATHRVMGMATTHRIAIISNHMRDISDAIEDEEKKAWGLCLAQSNSRFKVLDVYEFEGKTQVLLLHLPNDERWRLFEGVVMSVENDMVASCRERFENKCNAEVIPELATEEWLGRCAYPIGLDDDNRPFDVEIPLEDRFKPLGETGFREIAGAIIYARNAKDAINGEWAKENPEYPDYVAYGYIDRECGLSLHVLGSARIVDGETEYLHDLEDRALTLRSGGIEAVECAQVVDSALSEYAERITSVKEGYGMDDPQLVELRGIRMLDQFRHPQYPDDIRALIFKEGIEGVEQVWLRTCATNEDFGILARLLNEPNADFGAHEGDILPIGFAEGEDGLVCVAIPEPQELGSGQEAIDASGPHGEPYITVKRENAPVLALEEYQSGHDGEIADCFGAIIQAEAPIEEMWLCNRVRETFGIGRSGKNVQARSEAILKKVPHRTTRWNGKRFIWRKDQDPDSYTAYRANPERDSDRIAFQEIANAVLDVLSTSFPRDEEALVRSVASAFGYQRVASRIRETFAKAIKDMLRKGLVARDEDGLFALPKPEGFVFASGVELTDGGRVTEGYYMGDPETAIASVSLEKLEQVICFYIAAQEKKPVGFFLELPCAADEEDRLRENDEGPFHYGVYYSDALEFDSAIGLMHRYRDILLNSGLVTFGFFCNETESQITVDKYKVVTIIGLDVEVVDRIFNLSDVPKVRPVTAWDTISEKTPGKNFKVEVDGKTIDGFLPQMKRDFGLELDRYEPEEGDAARTDPGRPSPVEGSKPVMAPVCGGSVAVPDAYKPLPRKPDDPEWITGFALHTGNADIFIAVHPLDPDIELPYDAPDGLAGSIRARLPEGHAIVEAGSGATDAGKRYAYCITKQLREPSGVQYNLVFQIEQTDGPANVRGFFNEVGTTGVRDAMVFELRARELGGMQKAADGWMRDPYDPNLTEGFLKNGSEDSEYDAMFPAHPLSEARRLVSFIVEHDVCPEGPGAKPKPYIPAAHEEYGLLPYRREHGGEVFSYPAELDYIDKRIAEIEGDGETGERKVNVHPFKADSYDEYYGMLAELAEKYRPVDSELAEEIGLIIDIIKSMNVKEEWSIVRFVGDQFEGDSLADAHDLTKGRCYYWPCSKAHPVYEGVIDNEETTSYLYPCDPDSWEIVEDPTGMAARALAGDADTVEQWRVELSSDPDSFEAGMAEMGLVPKHKAAPSIQDFEEQEDLSDSEQDPVDFNCPDCGKPIHFEAWTLLNAQKDPEAAQRLIEGKLSEFTCPSCGYTTSLAHPCLYLDPEHNVFIYSVLDERMAGMAEEMFAEQPEGRRCRIVTSRFQLQDKAAIFMAGLDDRPMELLKTGLTGQAKLQGLVAEGEQCEVYFTGIGAEGELMFDIEIGDTTFTSSIDKGGYDLFASDLAKSSMADDDPLYVDREWAHRAIDAIAAKEPSPLQEPDPSQRHQIRYFFEHKLLPQLFFEDKGKFVNAVLGDEGLLFRALDGIFQKEGLDNPYSSDQLEASVETIAGDISILIIRYPDPEEEPLCYCSFLFFDAKFKNLGFYSLERGGDLSGDGIPFICSWSEEGDHINHGNCLLDEHEALLKCADIYMEKKKALKEKPKKSTQMCSTPGCGNPAAYKTRGKPAYCEDCIERIAAEAGLVLEEPMVKPNDFIMTICKKCGGRAHYRFNYILDKHGIGERVCRRCYWESWYQDSRDRFGVSQGHGNLMSEKGAKWLANQFGYDLIELVQGAIPGEELYHVKCQACGRVTYERFGDMAWCCSCSRKQKGSPKDADKLLRQALDM